MDIEIIDIRKITGDSNLKAFADIKMGGCMVIKGLTVIHGKNGLFVSMPKKQSKDGRWFEIFTPLDDFFKRDIQDKVMEAYDRETDGVST